MKTRQKKNGLPIVQTTVWGMSDESPSTPLSSTECSQKQRKAIYSNKGLFKCQGYCVCNVCFFSTK